MNPGDFIFDRISEEYGILISIGEGVVFSSDRVARVLFRGHNRYTYVVLSSLEKGQAGGNARED